MKKVFLPLLLTAAAACARPVAVTGPDGTTRLVPVPAEGTNWVGAVGVACDGSVVTNVPVWDRHGARGTIEWADGTKTRYRIPGPGEVVPVAHEARMFGRGRQRFRFGEVVWVDHGGNIVSNYIGKMYRELAGHNSRIAAAKELLDRRAGKKARELTPEAPDAALAAAKRHPEPNGYSTVPDGWSRRGRGRKAPGLFREPTDKPAAIKRSPPFDEDAEEILAEYRAKAKATPSHVEKGPGK